MQDKEKTYYRLFQEFPWVWGICKDWRVMERPPIVHNGEDLVSIGLENFVSNQLGGTIMFWVLRQGFPYYCTQNLTCHEICVDLLKIRRSHILILEHLCTPSGQDVIHVAISREEPRFTLDIYRKPQHQDFKEMIRNYLSS